MEILITDIETTGFNHQNDGILEIGAVSLNLKTGEIKEVFDSLLKEDLLTGRHHKAWIFQNSDLKVEDVRNAPAAEKVLMEFQEVVDAYPYGCTAFNNKFDFGFLENRGITFAKKLPCPMLLSTNICGIPSPRGRGLKWPNVEEAFKFFFPEHQYTEKHRGLDDSKHEAMIVHELYKRGVFKID
jgi:DNA polymerase-3 subunit epsilon